MVQNYDKNERFFIGGQVIVRNTYIGILENRQTVIQDEKELYLWNIRLNDESNIFEEEKYLMPLEFWISQQTDGGEGCLFHIFNNFFYCFTTIHI